MDGRGTYLKGSVLYCTECLQLGMAVNMVHNINIRGNVNAF